MFIPQWKTGAVIDARKVVGLEVNADKHISLSRWQNLGNIVRSICLIDLLNKREISNI
jgi:hypothetical protein